MLTGLQQTQEANFLRDRNVTCSHKVVITFEATTKGILALIKLFEVPASNTTPYAEDRRDLIAQLKRQLEIFGL